MKFHQLSVGQAFIFQGKAYVKASPVLAAEVGNGEQKFMRRADIVQLQEPQTSMEVTREEDDRVKKTAVVTLFEDFVTTCTELLATELDNIPQPQKNTIALQLKQARKRFLQDLALVSKA